MPACHVGIHLNSHGPNNSVVLGDVSGPSALMEATSCVDRGTAKVVLTGGTGTRIGTTRLNFRADYPMAESFDPVENSSRPHDPTSTGVVGGEGAAAMVIRAGGICKTARCATCGESGLLLFKVCSCQGNEDTDAMQGNE